MESISWLVHQFFLFSFSKDDNGQNISCVIVPVYCSPMLISGLVNGKCKYIQLRIYVIDLCVSSKCIILSVSQDSPSGSPSISPKKVEAQINEHVELECVTDSIDGNPDCDIFAWYLIDYNSGMYPIYGTSQFVFIMNESMVGNYAVQCGNPFGWTNLSRPAEVILKGMCELLSVL